MYMHDMSGSISDQCTCTRGCLVCTWTCKINGTPAISIHAHKGMLTHCGKHATKEVNIVKIEIEIERYHLTGSSNSQLVCFVSQLQKIKHWSL